jgi:hypothetical protein
MTPVTLFIVVKISGVRIDTVVIIADGRLEWISHNRKEGPINGSAILFFINQRIFRTDRHCRLNRQSSVAGREDQGGENRRKVEN